MVGFFQNLKRTLFVDNGTPYADAAVAENIKASVKEHQDVVEFEKAFSKAFETFS